MKTPKILKKISPNQIAWLEASSNYTYINLSSGKRLISSYSLQVFEELIDEKIFIRVDRSNMVNRNFINSISSNGNVKLKNKHELQIPRRRKAMIFDQYPNLLINLQTTI